MCRSDPKQSRKPYKEVKTTRADLSDVFVIGTVNFVNSQSAIETEAIEIIKILSGKVRVKLHTGAEVNVMPNRVYQKLVTGRSMSNGVEIQATSTKLTGYRGAKINVLRHIGISLYKLIYNPIQFY